MRRIDKNWFEARLHGRVGIVPANYIQVSQSVSQSAHLPSSSSSSSLSSSPSSPSSSSAAAVITVMKKSYRSKKNYILATPTFSKVNEKFVFISFVFKNFNICA